MAECELPAITAMSPLMDRVLLALGTRYSAGRHSAVSTGHRVQNVVILQLLILLDLQSSTLSSAVTAYYSPVLFLGPSFYSRRCSQSTTLYHRPPAKARTNRRARWLRRPAPPFTVRNSHVPIRNHRVRKPRLSTITVDVLDGPECLLLAHNFAVNPIAVSRFYITARALVLSPLPRPAVTAETAEKVFEFFASVNSALRVMWERRGVEDAVS